MQIYIEILIVILLLVLVIERFFGDNVKAKQTPKEIKKKVLKDKKTSSIMGDTKHIPKVQEVVKNTFKPTVEKQEKTTKARKNNKSDYTKRRIR